MTAPVRRFSYQVVTHNGAGTHGPLFARCADAKANARRLSEARHVAIIGPYEVQRIQHTGYNARRYQMRQGERWVKWDPRRGAEQRQPDWLYPALVAHDQA